MCRVYYFIYLGPRARSPNYQKLCTPSNRSLRMWRTSAQSKCYDRPLLGRSSFLIKDDPSARMTPVPGKYADRRLYGIPECPGPEGA
ncbi:hypothetical protein CDAR_462821 [Caerostris darwini]|uniref:Uncharacterized protein n=1 Tax=Caerostris darwini TaxID=1538125 RepID=A0AAV4QW85_9ARAC|nr:hypothetical protein CDAR_462821 [Caerostris darwini]